jgi:hypothetical protein
MQPLFGGFAARSGADPDFYKFQVETFSTVKISLEWYPLLAKLYLLLDADDPDSRGPAEMARSGSSATGTATLQGLLAPGVYRINIGGTGDTAYRLAVIRQPAAMPRDAFEPNDSFEHAARLIFEPRKGGKWGFAYLREWGPGTYPATLHAVLSYVTLGFVINADHYVFDVPASSVFRVPTVSVWNTDVPLDVTLYDGVRNVIQSWTNVRAVDVKPPEKTTCYLKVSGKVVNRYSITVGLRADPRAIPGPLQEAPPHLPKWWGRPDPLRIFERERLFAVELGSDRGDGDAVLFAKPDEPVRIELLDEAGNVLREAIPTRTALVLATGELAGRYVVRVTRDAGIGASASPVELRMLAPKLR